MTTKVSSSLLANTAVVAGTYGSSSTVPIIVIDAQGRITSATAATISGGGGGGGSGTTTFTRQSFTATSGQTAFTPSGGYTVGYLQVYVNGVLLNSTDYAAADGTTFTLSTGCTVGDIVESIAYSVAAVSNITGGAAGAILYQAAANTTSNTDVGTSGQLLLSAGAGKPTWSSTITNTTLANFTELSYSIGNSGSSQTLSLTNGTVQTTTLTANCTFTMPTAVVGKSFLLFANTGAGSFTTTTFTGVKWAANQPPTITSTAYRTDILSFVSDGTSWYGSYTQAYQ
jgi:hypothetical protein